MRKLLAVLLSLCMVSGAFAGFKVKLIRAKKPEQFQSRLAVGQVVFAADLVVDEKDQKTYFYKELAPAHVMAIRLAVFNQGTTGVVLPLAQLQLFDPSGKEVTPVAPDAVAEAVLRGLVVSQKVKEAPVAVSTVNRDPRLDPTDPRYDPRVDPNDPRYDPRADPTDPRYDPRYDPRTGTGGPGYQRYPNGTVGPWYRPGVDVVLNPGGGSGGDLSQFERSLVEKDFFDKAHSLDPVLPTFVRDKFLYFVFEESLGSTRGFKLKLPKTKGMPEEIVLKF